MKNYKAVTLTGVCVRVSAMDFSTEAPKDQRIVATENATDTPAVTLTGACVRVGAMDFLTDASEDQCIVDTENPTDTPAATTLGRRTRQQTRDEMYEHLEELSQRNCRINQENTSHEHYRIAKALRRE